MSREIYKEKKCNYCKKEIDTNTQPSFSHEYVKDTGNYEHYHQRCLFIWVAREIEDKC